MGLRGAKSAASGVPWRRVMAELGATWVSDFTHTLMRGNEVLHFTHLTRGPKLCFLSAAICLLFDVVLYGTVHSSCSFLS